MDKQKLDRLLLRPTEAGEVLGVARSTIYELIASRDIPSIRVGKRGIRVPADALRKWIADRLDDQGGSATR